MFYEFIGKLIPKPEIKKKKKLKEKNSTGKYPL